MNKTRKKVITFDVSNEFAEALDAAALDASETRSQRVRKVLAKYLRDAGHLHPKSPTTRREAKRLAAI